MPQRELTLDYLLSHQWHMMSSSQDHPPPLCHPFITLASPMYNFQSSEWEERRITALHTLICSRVCSLHSNLTLMCICNKADGNVSTCGCLQQKHLSAGLCACVCVAGCGSTDCLPAEVIIDCQEAAPSARDLLRFISSTDCTGKHYKFIQKW